MLCTGGAEAVLSVRFLGKVKESDHQNYGQSHLEEGEEDGKFSSQLPVRCFQ